MLVEWRLESATGTEAIVASWIRLSEYLISQDQSDRATVIV